MYRLLLGLSVTLTIGLVAQAQPVTGVSGGQISDLVGSPTMVTVVLEDSGAKDPNLRIVEVHDGYIAFMTDTGDRTAYTRDAIAEIQVQGGAIDKPRFELGAARALRADEQAVVDRALIRSNELFQNATDQQQLRIRAAAILTHNNSPDTLEYLQQLVAANDVGTNMEAATALYLAGQDVPLATVREGLASTSLRTRGEAIDLAGLLDMRDTIPTFLPLASDRAAEIAAPAARSLARMGERDVIPSLLGLISEPDDVKGEAAIWSLTKLGGSDLAEQMKIRLQNADGMVRYRIIRVLHQLGDPQGRRLLSEILQNTPTLAYEAALILARNGDWDGAEYLRNRLNRRESTSDVAQIERGRSAAALIAGGDPSAISHLQDLLRSSSSRVRVAVLQMIEELGERRMLTVIQSAIESSDNEVALEAATTAVSLANATFMERLRSYRTTPPYLEGGVVPR